MTTERNSCIRCGECCMGAGPTLHLEDREVIGKGAVERKDLYTIRRGEVVRDNVRGELVRAGGEMLKVREREEGGCVFYDPSGAGCTIYPRRPAQCRALACWDTSGFMEVFRHPHLTRWDLVHEAALMALMEAHESRCGYEKLAGYVARIPEDGEKALEQVLETLRFDAHVRHFTIRKLDADPALMDLFFGRPLSRTIEAFGLTVKPQPDGSFLLTTLADP